MNPSATAHALAFATHRLSGPDQLIENLRVSANIKIIQGLIDAQDFGSFYASNSVLGQ
jgi:hypothetical protein